MGWDRLHLDHESGLATTGDGNYPFLLTAMVRENDYSSQASNRWNTENVPGFGHTMQYLWDHVPALWTTTASACWGASDPTASGVLDTSVGFQSPNNYNQDVFLWYQSVGQRAINAALKECAYDPAQAQFTGCKTSNYAHTFIDAVEDLTGNPLPSDFGWHWQRYTAGTPMFEREGLRGVKDTDQHGYNLPDISDGQFFVGLDNAASGNFSAPVLYVIGADDPSHDPDGDWHYYQETNPYIPGYPADTCWDASLRWHRRWLESTIDSYAQNTDDTAPWTKVSPWVPIVGVGITRGEPGDQPWPERSRNYVVVENDVNRQLSLIKSKRLVEMIVWDDDNLHGGIPGTTDMYQQYKKVYEQVYDPYMDNYTRIFGSLDTTIHTDTTPLRDTNGRWQSSVYKPLVAKFDAPRDGAADHRTLKVGVQCAFKGVLNGPTTMPSDETWALDVECTGSMMPVPTSTPSPTLHLFGRVYMWNYSLSVWVAFNIGDSTDATVFEFSAPEDPSSPYHSFKWLSRRRFTLCGVGDPSEFANSSGHAKARVVVYAEPDASLGSSAEFASGDVLHASFDLVQLVRVSKCVEDSEEMMAFRADSDASGAVDEADVSMFADCYEAGGVVADQDGDGEVTDADLDLFLTDYTNSK